eukprot:Gb_07586 [translate_table: standard]
MSIQIYVSPNEKNLSVEKNPRVWKGKGGGRSVAVRRNGSQQLCSVSDEAWAVGDFLFDILGVCPLCVAVTLFMDAIDSKPAVYLGEYIHVYPISNKVKLNYVDDFVWYITRAHIPHGRIIDKEHTNKPNSFVAGGYDKEEKAARKSSGFSRGAPDSVGNKVAFHAFNAIDKQVSLKDLNTSAFFFYSMIRSSLGTIARLAKHGSNVEVFDQAREFTSPFLRCHHVGKIQGPIVPVVISPLGDQRKVFSGHAAHRICSSPPSPIFTVLVPILWTLAFLLHQHSSQRPHPVYFEVSCPIAFPASPLRSIASFGSLGCMFSSDVLVGFNYLFDFPNSNSSLNRELLCVISQLGWHYGYSVLVFSQAPDIFALGFLQNSEHRPGILLCNKVGVLNAGMINYSTFFNGRELICSGSVNGYTKDLK